MTTITNITDPFILQISAPRRQTLVEIQKRWKQILGKEYDEVVIRSQVSQPMWQILSNCDHLVRFSSLSRDFSSHAVKAFIAQMKYLKHGMNEYVIEFAQSLPESGQSSDLFSMINQCHVDPFYLDFGLPRQLPWSIHGKDGREYVLEGAYTSINTIECDIGVNCPDFIPHVKDGISATVIDITMAGSPVDKKHVADDTYITYSLWITNESASCSDIVAQSTALQDSDCDPNNHEAFMYSANLICYTIAGLQNKSITRHPVDEVAVLPKKFSGLSFTANRRFRKQLISLPPRIALRLDGLHDC